MNKRDFLGATMLLASPAAATAAPAQRKAGPVLLTITGKIGRANRGPFDPGRDILMGKHKLGFTQALALDFAALAALPAQTIAPTLEYDGKVHRVRGPLLTDVLLLAGVRLTDASRLALRALDGYAASVDGATVRSRRFLLATHLDGQPMALGGLGPLWAVFDADRIAEVAAMPLAERFGNCPWGLYHIDVLA